MSAEVRVALSAVGVVALFWAFPVGQHVSGVLGACMTIVGALCVVRLV